MLLLPLLLAFATTIFCSPLHSGQTVNEAAELARRVVKDAGNWYNAHHRLYAYTFAGIGTILTLVDESIQPNVGGMVVVVDRGIHVIFSHDVNHRSSFWYHGILQW